LEPTDYNRTLSCKKLDIIIWDTRGSLIDIYIYISSEINVEKEAYFIHKGLTIEVLLMGNLKEQLEPC
jgi:hypothetical protein